MGKLPETVWHTLHNWYLGVYQVPEEGMVYNEYVEDLLITALACLKALHHDQS